MKLIRDIETYIQIVTLCTPRNVHKQFGHLAISSPQQQKLTSEGATIKLATKKEQSN